MLSCFSMGNGVLFQLIAILNAFRDMVRCYCAAVQLRILWSSHRFQASRSLALELLLENFLDRWLRCRLFFLATLIICNG
eukprot:SAG31_NODE_4448_length_3222_cov_34.014089_2_plen_80_part_00